MSEALVPVDPTSPEAKEAILSLLGTTLAELKAIDRNVVGSSKHIAGNRTNLQDVFKITGEAPVTPAAQPAQPAQPVTVQNVQPTPVQAPITTIPQPEQESDPNQLVFDFNQKITPDVINNKLDRILDKLDRIIEKVEKNSNA